VQYFLLQLDIGAYSVHQFGSGILWDIVPLWGNQRVSLLVKLLFSRSLIWWPSHSWISSLSMIIASSPSLNPAIEEDEKDVAGSLAGFCLTGGLVGGSLASFIVGWIVKR
jgi:hypothetical protein